MVISHQAHTCFHQLSKSETAKQQIIQPVHVYGEEVVDLSRVGPGLDEPVRHGARYVIQQAIEAELPALLERFESVMACVQVRNGYMSDCDVAITAGSIALQVPKDRDRSGFGVKFNSSIVPPRVRMTPRVTTTSVVASEGHLDGRRGEQLGLLLDEDAKAAVEQFGERTFSLWGPTTL